jgi:hypothetical protein
MPSPGMVRRMALVGTDDSEEHSASIIRVTRNSELGTTLAVTSNRLLTLYPSSPILVTRMMEALRSFEPSVLTTATRRDTPGDGILHSHRHENLTGALNSSIKCRDYKCPKYFQDCESI